MKFQLFSVYDAKGEVFLSPFVARSEVEMRRMLTESFRDRNFVETPAGRYPQEFVVYRVGTFEDDFGKLEPADGGMPVRICSLDSLRPAAPDAPAQFTS